MPNHLQTLGDRDLGRALAHARNRRDAYTLGREPAEVLDLLARLTREQEARRLMRRANQTRA